MEPNSTIPPPIPARPAMLDPSHQLHQPANFNQLLPYSQPAYAPGLYNYYPQTSYIGTLGDTNMIFGNNTAGGSISSAFQSVESIINAFVSVANLLNSTHSALINSFRAVIGVITQFKALKRAVIANVMVSLIRWTRFLWRRSLAFLHLRPRNYASSETIWENINSNQQLQDPKTNSKNGILIFWLIAIGGPFVLYKYIVKPALEQVESNNWSDGTGEHYSAQALYDFNGANPNELSFCAFDMLRIAPKWKQPNVKDWLLASNFDGSKVGLVPINYIKLLKKFNVSGNVAEQN